MILILISEEPHSAEYWEERAQALDPAGGVFIAHKLEDVQIKLSGDF